MGIIVFVSKRDYGLLIPLEIPDSQLEQLRAGAELVECSVEELILRAITAEARRQFYIVRSQPKPSAPKTPVGRPRISAEEKKFRELKQLLEGIYLKLRALRGEDFEEVHREDYAELCKLLETNDLQGLEGFLRDQPWQKIRSGN